MGYFSELDLINRENYTDRSYHGFEEQVLWRYEDLKERYSLLSRDGAPMHGDDYFSKNDYNDNRKSKFLNFDRKSEICKQISKMKFDDFCCNDADAKSPMRLFEQLNSQLRKDYSVFSTSYSHYRRFLPLGVYIHREEGKRQFLL